VKKILVLYIFVFTLVLSGCSSFSYKETHGYENQISQNIGMTEANGLKAVSVMKKLNEYRVTVFFTEPVDKSSFLSLCKDVKNDVTDAFGAKSGNIKELMISLSENGKYVLNMNSYDLASGNLIDSAANTITTITLD
jgi:hypothetical protein